MLGPDGGLGPVPVGGALGGVVAHLAFDHARGAAQPPTGEQLEQDLLARPGVRLVKRLRGKSPGATRWSGGRPAGCG